MAEHVHGCLNCRPDMVPDFDTADPRFHSAPKCGATISITLNGAATGYTTGVFEGPEGWVLAASHTLDTAEVHRCPNCTVQRPDGSYGLYATCVQPLFGDVAVSHGERFI